MTGSGRTRLGADAWETSSVTGALRGGIRASAGIAEPSSDERTWATERRLHDSSHVALVGTTNSPIPLSRLVFGASADGCGELVRWAAGAWSVSEAPQGRHKRERPRRLTAPARPCRKAALPRDLAGLAGPLPPDHPATTTYAWVNEDGPPVPLIGHALAH